MKYLEYESLEQINSALSCVDTGDCRIFTRLEAYSCKTTNEEKKLRHHLESKYEDDIATLAASPDHGSFTLSPTSPFGPLTQPTSRKTLFYLLATLNSAFPDYEFRVNQTLFNVVAGSAQTVLPSSLPTQVWEAVNEVVQLVECDIYGFHPDPDSEPDADEGSLWSFYYFFFNKKLKRVLFFTARAVSFMAPVQPEEVVEMMEEQFAFDDELQRQESGLSYEQYNMETMEV